MAIGPTTTRACCFLSQVKRLRDAGIGVYMVRGNHDTKSKLTASLSLRLPEGVVNLSTSKPETKVLDHLGVAIHGRGYPKWNTTDDLSAAYPRPLDGYFNIGLLHTCAESHGDHERYAPCTLDGLTSKGYSYWALGHVHAREVLRTEPWIVFPGNLRAVTLASLPQRGVRRHSGRRECVPRTSAARRRAVGTLRSGCLKGGLRR